MKAIASIRNGPIIILNEDNESCTYEPLSAMVERLYASTPPQPSDPIVILYRHRTGILYYSATKQKRTHPGDAEDKDANGVVGKSSQPPQPNRSQAQSTPLPNSSKAKCLDNRANEAECHCDDEIRCTVHAPL